MPLTQKHPPLVSLAKIRRAREKTQQQLSIEAEISPALISAYERGLGCPPNVRARIAAVLDVDPRDLIEQRKLVIAKA